MNEKGYILLSRSILDSDVFASQKLLKIWVWCLCKANFKDRSVPLKVGRGETIVKVKRGSFLFGRFKAEQDLFIDGSTIYKSIKKLEEMDMIKIESNNQYSIVTICKYNDYQDNDNYKVTTKEQPSSNKVTTKEQPSNTTNTLPNDKKDNNVKKQKVYSKEVNDCFNNCLNYFPEHLQPKNKNSWLDTIEKLNRIDNIPFKIIEEIVKKTREDNFWSKNFLSLNKLRDKNKDGIKYIIVFNEQIKVNGTTKTRKQRFTEAIQKIHDSE